MNTITLIAQSDPADAGRQRIGFVAGSDSWLNPIVYYTGVVSGKYDEQTTCAVTKPALVFTCDVLRGAPLRQFFVIWQVGDRLIQTWIEEDTVRRLVRNGAPTHQELARVGAGAEYVTQHRMVQDSLDLDQEEMIEVGSTTASDTQAIQPGLYPRRQVTAARRAFLHELTTLLGTLDAAHDVHVDTVPESDQLRLAIDQAITDLHLDPRLKLRDAIERHVRPLVEPRKVPA